jgi:hypothetical protein
MCPMSGKGEVVRNSGSGYCFGGYSGGEVGEYPAVVGLIGSGENAISGSWSRQENPLRFESPS